MKSGVRYSANRRGRPLSKNSAAPNGPSAARANQASERSIGRDVAALHGTCLLLLSDKRNGF